eukprot:TRINITY_DN56923_c0_g1_i1.p1 TRINITY_DN56923_c0_g1~~TRINITY_DN56923_c0_g1_i1.p1  ORF type:complete len:456 (-),score=58.86 TRINITY_DN56923_c0_g1_i1:148-1476(-)
MKAAGVLLLVAVSSNAQQLRARRNSTNVSLGNIKGASDNNFSHKSVDNVTADRNIGRHTEGHEYSYRPVSQEVSGFCLPSGFFTGDLCRTPIPPGSAQTCANIDAQTYLKDCDEDCAQRLCSMDVNCEGYTRHPDNKFKLKETIEGVANESEAGYACLRKVEGKTYSYSMVSEAGGYCNPESFAGHGDLCHGSLSNASHETCRGLDESNYLADCDQRCAIARCDLDDHCVGYTLSPEGKVKLKSQVSGWVGNSATDMEYACFRKAEAGKKLLSLVSVKCIAPAMGNTSNPRLDALLAAVGDAAEATIENMTFAVPGAALVLAELVGPLPDSFPGVGEIPGADAMFPGEDHLYISVDDIHAWPEGNEYVLTVSQMEHLIGYQTELDREVEIELEDTAAEDEGMDDIVEVEIGPDHPLGSFWYILKNDELGAVYQVHLLVQEVL